jgi:hypothetical protein
MDQCFKVAKATRPAQGVGALKNRTALPRLRDFHLSFHLDGIEADAQVFISRHPTTKAMAVLSMPLSSNSSFD